MVEFDERSPWNGARILLIIGPGGAGKSSLAVELAPLLKRRLVDLDDEFRRRIEDISNFMRREGYESYKMQNAALAAEIASEAVVPSVIVASSGFLTPDNPELALKANKVLLKSCYSMSLLPSRDLEQSINIIVERQSGRPFARDRTREEAAIRARYPVYVSLGDLRVFSALSAAETAKAVAHRFYAEA